MSQPEDDFKPSIMHGIKDISFGTLCVAAGCALAPLVLQAIGMREIFLRALSSDPLTQNGMLSAVGVIVGVPLYISYRLLFSRAAKNILQHRYTGIFARSFYISLIIFILISLRIMIQDGGDLSTKANILAKNMSDAQSAVSRLDASLNDFKNSISYVQDMKEILILMNDVKEFKT